MSVIRNSDDRQFTKSQLYSLIVVFGEAIRESKGHVLGGVPAGSLYGLSAMPAGVSLATFEACISTLERAGLVARRNQLLVWVGPDVG